MKTIRKVPLLNLAMANSGPCPVAGRGTSSVPEVLLFKTNALRKALLTFVDLVNSGAICCKGEYRESLILALAEANEALNLN